jgi:hypothetical protein
MGLCNDCFSAFWRLLLCTSPLAFTLLVDNASLLHCHLQLVSHAGHLLHYRFEGDATPNSTNSGVGMTLPEYLEGRVAQIDVFDNESGLLFGSGVVSLKDLSHGVMTHGGLVYVSSSFLHRCICLLHLFFNEF